MTLLSDFTSLTHKFHDLVFPYGAVKRQLLGMETSQDGSQPHKVLYQVAKIINTYNNSSIRASVKNTIMDKMMVPELVININADLSGLSTEEKESYGERLADLVGHHEGQLKHLSYNKKGFSYKIHYIGNDDTESCTRCAKVVVHIREASARVSKVVDEINMLSASKRAYLSYLNT